MCGRLRPERHGHQALSDAGSGRFSVFPTRMDKATAQRPAPRGLTMVTGHRAKERPPQTHKGHADELGALLGEARVPLRGPLGVAAAGWAEQASVSSSLPPGRRSYFSIL